MVQLSVNVNKIATLRNARGGNEPHLITAVKKILSYGVKGITVHPRPDGRHIIYQDVEDIAQLFQEYSSEKPEFNIEGYPSHEFLQLIKKIKPQQCTLVPDPPEVLTSNAGWKIKEHSFLLNNTLLYLRELGIRSSVFLDPFTFNEEEMESLNQLKPDRVELYTEKYAKHYNTASGSDTTNTYKHVAKTISSLKIEINAGHDLNLHNLAFLLKHVPEIKEVSIGHALICESLWQGMKQVVQSYLKICTKKYIT